MDSEPMKNNNTNFKILSSTLHKHLKRRASILNTTLKSKMQQKAGKKNRFTTKQKFNVNLMRPKKSSFLNNQTEFIEVEVVSEYTQEEPGKKSLAQLAAEADTDVDETEADMDHEANEEDFSDYKPTQSPIRVDYVDDFDDDEEPLVFLNSKRNADDNDIYKLTTSKKQNTT